METFEIKTYTEEQTEALKNFVNEWKIHYRIVTANSDESIPMVSKKSERIVKNIVEGYREAHHIEADSTKTKTYSTFKEFFDHLQTRSYKAI